MSRRIDLGDLALRVRYDGFDAAFAVKRELEIPYHSIDEAAIGLDDPPSKWTVRRLGTADPFTGIRKGRFWVGGKRLFLDFRHAEHTLVLRIKPGYDYDVVAIETDHPESLLAAIRAKLPT